LQKAANVNKVENVDIPEVVRKHCLHQVRVTIPFRQIVKLNVI